MAKKNKSAIIRKFLTDNPTMRPTEVAKKLGVSLTLVSVCKTQLRKKGVDLPILRDTQPKKVSVIALPVIEPKQIEMFEPKHDPVNHPAHYKVGGIETIDFIKAKLTPEEYRGYLKGNILKYGSRIGHKDAPAVDAGKIGWYANALAEEMKSV